MCAHKVTPGWRLRTAQAVLRLLFGRSNMYVSPFKDAGVGTSLVVLTADGQRALLHRRAGTIEGIGKWGTFGGFIDLAAHEPVAQALAREVYEESQLRLPETQFARSPDFAVLLHGQEKNQMGDYASCNFCYFAQAGHDFIKLVQETDEAVEFTWLSEQDIDDLWEAGMIASKKEDVFSAIKTAFAKHRSDGSLPELVLK